MTEIKLKKRYPQSRTEDITDAFMRGYEQGKKDGLKVGKQIVLGAFETYITADRKTEPQPERHLPDYSYEADLGRRIMEQTKRSK